MRSHQKSPTGTNMRQHYVGTVQHNLPTWLHRVCFSLPWHRRYDANILSPPSQACVPHLCQFHPSCICFEIRISRIFRAPSLPKNSLTASWSEQSALQHKSSCGVRKVRFGCCLQSLLSHQDIVSL